MSVSRKVVEEVNHDMVVFHFFCLLGSTPITDMFEQTKESLLAFGVLTTDHTSKC